MHFGPVNPPVHTRKWLYQHANTPPIPGSSLHAIKTLSNPRWEDFQYEYVNDNPNGWLGDGWSQDEKDENIKIDYLDDDAINFPRPPERIARDRSREKLLSNNGCR